MNGSSPLTRGKRVLETRLIHFARLIPAHAGKTTVRGRRRRSRPAHPRSRGENTRRINVDDLCAGSSPLTRGKPAVDHAGVRPVRLIPAHAGKT